MEGIAFIFGALLSAAAILGFKYGDALKNYFNTSKVEKTLSSATPTSLPPAVTAGWALAGGLGFGILFPNLSALLLSDDSGIKVAAAALFLVPFSLVTIYFLHISRKYLHLNRRWTALAWAHYRPLLFDLSSATNHSFDFVTHTGGDLFDGLESKAKTQLAYGLNSFHDHSQRETPDILVADFDVIESIKERIKHDSTLLPVRNWKIDDCYLELLFSNPTRESIMDAVSLPLRWGFNTFAVKTVEQYTIPGDHVFNASVSVPEYLKDPCTVSSIGLHFTSTPPILLLDWYLPVLAAIAQSTVGQIGWAAAHDDAIHEVKKTLDYLKQALLSSAKSNGLKLDFLFSRDVLELKSKVEGLRNCIVLAGGNFLWNPGKNEDDILLLPFDIDGKPKCLIWREVILITQAINRNPGYSNSQSDIPGLVEAIYKNLAKHNENLAVHGFLPIGVSNPESAAYAKREGWSEFARNHNTRRTLNTFSNERWSKIWRDWRESF